MALHRLSPAVPRAERRPAARPVASSPAGAQAAPVVHSVIHWNRACTRLISSLTWSRTTLALGHLGADLVAGVHDGRVVAAAELLGDLRVAVVGELPEDVHPDLAGGHQGPAPARAAEVVDRPAEHLRRLVEDELGGDDPGSARREQVGEDGVGDLLGEGDPVEARVGRDPDQGALELADVVDDVRRDEREDLGGDAVEPLGVGLLAEDREARLELGRLDVGDEAPLEAAPEPVLDASRSTWAAGPTR